MPTHHQHLFIFVLLTAAAVQASPLDLYYSHHQEKLHKVTSLKSADTVKEYYYSQLIDHTKPEIGSFLQRYYVDDSYSLSNDSPVFLYLCGESSCEKTVLDNTIRDLAKKHHAKLIAIEHRYYGKSMPRSSLSIDDMKYLTAENAIQDVVSFVKESVRINHWSGKWITFGGSYSATIATFFREKYPELTAGAVASSAPVIPMETFEGYDAYVTKVIDPQCADNMRKAVHEIESAMTQDQTHMAEIKAMFHASEIKDDVDFLGLIADINSFAVQYGYKDTLCGVMEQGSTPLEGNAMFANYLFDAIQVEPVKLTPQGAMSENPADYDNFIGMRQWYYQTCSEFGAWTIAHPDPNQSTRSSLLTKEYSQNVCKRLFGINDAPNIEKFKTEFYLPLLNESTSRIYFTNGSNDPWSRMSMIDENGNTTNKNLSYFMIEGGAHCDDLRANTITPSLQAARDKMDNLIEHWVQA